MQRRHDAGSTRAGVMVAMLIAGCGGSTPATERPGPGDSAAGSAAGSADDGSTLTPEIGGICVIEATAEGRVALQVGPRGCISSALQKDEVACTVALGDGDALHVEGRFRYTSLPGIGASLPDCGGGGQATCAVDGLAPGTYKISVGDETLDVTLGAPLDGDHCIGRPY